MSAFGRFASKLLKKAVNITVSSGSRCFFYAFRVKGRFPPQLQTFPRVVGAPESRLSATRARTIKAVRLLTRTLRTFTSCANPRP